MYVCLCRGITDQQIREAIQDGAQSVMDVAQRLGAGTGCGGCLEYTQALIDQGSASQSATRDLTYAA